MPSSSTRLPVELVLVRVRLFTLALAEVRLDLHSALLTYCATKWRRKISMATLQVYCRRYPAGRAGLRACQPGRRWPVACLRLPEFLAPMCTRGTRNISKAWSPWKNFNRISRANIVTRGTRNISKRWSTWKISIAFLSQLAPISRLAPLAKSPKLGRLQKFCNRIFGANIVTSATRNISKRWSTSKTSIAFLAPISWPEALATSPNVGGLQKISIEFLAPISRLVPLAASPKLGRLQTIFNRIFRANIVTSATRNISKRWSTSKNFKGISRANMPILGLEALATSPNVGRLQKVSIVFLAPITWPAPLATSPNVGRLPNFQSHFSRQSRD